MRGFIASLEKLDGVRVARPSISKKLSFRGTESEAEASPPFETLATLAPQGEVLVLRSARSARLEARALGLSPE
jgi:hypothetical protein